MLCTGPSGISSTQQKLLDNLDDDKFGSPVMKQCRGEDDTSSGMSYLLLNELLLPTGIVLHFVS